MAAAKDPTRALKEAAAALPDAAESTSCNQTSFKVGKKAFLYVGPGAKGVGYKAMFKLDASLEAARALAEAEPRRFEVGAVGWATARFSAEAPLPKKIWGRWLKESHATAAKPATAKKTASAKKTATPKKKTANAKKSAKRPRGVR